VIKAGSGSGSVTSSSGGIECGSVCSAPHAAAPVTLTATAAPGSSFAGWSGDCSGTGPCTLTMSADRAATATFEIADQMPPVLVPPVVESDKTLTIARAGRGTGTVTSSPAGISCGAVCAQTFAHSTSVTLAAAASARSRFAGWSGACSGTGSCTVSLSEARSVTATFKPLCVVPKLKGKTLRAAKLALTQAKCSVGKVTRAFSAQVRKGRVLAQKPRPGRKLAAGSKISLKLSKGKSTSL
jgi:Divergent InlB B-repeat domain/PASTA domain